MPKPPPIPDPEPSFTYEAMTVYELCALYCDYHEYLASPTMGPSTEYVKGKYGMKLLEIHEELHRKFENLA